MKIVDGHFFKAMFMCTLLITLTWLKTGGIDSRRLIMVIVYYGNRGFMATRCLSRVFDRYRTQYVTERKVVQTCCILIDASRHKFREMKFPRFCYCRYLPSYGMPKLVSRIGRPTLFVRALPGHILKRRSTYSCGDDGQSVHQKYCIHRRLHWEVCTLATVS